MATRMKEKPADKHDAFIEGQLARAKNRIRLIDLATAMLGLIAGTLAFAVLVILLDRRFVLSDASRQATLFFYLLAAGAYLVFVVVRPLRWRVNPHYAARQLEQTLPGSRNHVINWIDLQGEKAPAVLKNSLGQRAARDLSKIDVDGAISSRQAFGVGGTAAFFAVVFLALFFLLGPRPFGSLLGRAFAPFGGKIASRTQVRILRPQNGDATITIGNPITIVAEVSGRVPSARDKDAPCLLYRHEEGEPYRKRFLQPDESSQEWAATVGPLDVSNGFTYKVAAGDSETPEYRVSVRAAPLISEFLATYHYRDYLNRADHTRTDRKLEDYRGTLVTITARTNRVLKEGRLDFDGADGVGDLIRPEPVPNEPQVLRFRMVLDRAGKYRLRFTSIEGEAYVETTSSDVVVIPDLPPRVRLTEPAKDVTLPANGQLELKGDATDDFGVARLTLRLHIVGGGKLKAKPYMADKLGQPNFGTPRVVEYRDLLELTSLTDAQGKPANLKPGTEIEYWLEAADACDYPRPNVTVSRPRYKIKIAEPQDDGKQQKQREEAEKRQKQHEAQQAEQMKQEKAGRAEQRRKEEAQEKADADKREAERTKGKNDPKDKGAELKKPADKGEEGAKNEDTRKTAEKLKQELEKKREEEKRGESRGGEDNRPGKSKNDGEKKPGEGKDSKPGEKKEGGGQDGKNPAGEKKEGGKPGEKGSARSEGKPDPKDKKGEGKQGADRGGEGGKQPGQGKEGPAPKPKPGEGKGEETGEPAKEAGARKPQSDPKPGDRIRQGEGRGEAGKPTDRKPDEGKDGVKPRPGASPGEGKTKGDKGGAGKPTAGASGSGKDKPSAKTGDPLAQPGEKKGDGGDKKRPRPEDAKPSDVADQKNDLKAPDRLTRDEAKSVLENIEKRAKDPKAREAAKEALKEAKKNAQPGQGKPDFGDSAAPEKVEKGERKPGNGPGEKGVGKEGDLPADPAEPRGKRGEGIGPGKGKNPGEETGEGGADSRPGDRRTTGQSGKDEPAKPEKPVSHRASMLQLEEFRKNVDRDVLKKLKMSPEEYEKFLRDYAELAKRAPKADSDAPEDVAAPRGSGTLPSIAGGSRTGSGKTDDVRSQGRPQPPPGYREPYQDFIRRLGETPK